MDPVSQAWAAYYQQYYQQAGVMSADGSTAAASAAPATATTSTPSASASGQSTDYSQAWVEYYRSMGMYAEAEAILKQTQVRIYEKFIF